MQTSQKTSTYQDLVNEHEKILFLDRSLHNTESLWNLLKSSSLTFVNQNRAIFFHDDNRRLRVTNPDAIIMSLPEDLLSHSSDNVALIHQGSAGIVVISFKSFMKDAFIPELLFVGGGKAVTHLGERVLATEPLSHKVLNELKKKGVVHDLTIDKSKKVYNNVTIMGLNPDGSVDKEEGVLTIKQRTN